MAVGVVDVLEVVDVEVGDGDGLPRGLGAGERDGQPCIELRPVHQAGQRVVRGPAGQLLGRAMSLGDVSGEGDDRTDVGVVEEVVAGRLEPDPVAGLRSEEHTSELPSLMRISYAV